MHEMSLVAGIMRILEDEARAQEFSRVRTVVLEVGGLSHADAEALRFAFEAQKPGTLAAAARLDIVTTPGTAWCMDCAEPVPLARRGDACPRCGGYKLQVTAGEDLRVRELEVE